MRGSLLGAGLLVMAGCGYSETEEMDRELAAIEARVPKGTPLAGLAGRMRALLLHERQVLSGVLVNAGLFCF